jgi:hypothetical protein
VSPPLSIREPRFTNTRSTPRSSTPALQHSSTPALQPPNVQSFLLPCTGVRRARARLRQSITSWSCSRKEKAYRMSYCLVFLLCFALPYLTLPCLALPCLALPCLALPCLLPLPSSLAWPCLLARKERFIETINRHLRSLVTQSLTLSSAARNEGCGHLWRRAEEGS